MFRAPLLRAFLGLLIVCAACAVGPPPGAAAPVAARSHAQAPAAAPRQLLIGFRPGTSEAERAAIVARNGGRIIQRLESARAYLIELPPSQPLGVAGAAFVGDAAVAYAEPNYQYQAAAIPDDSNWGDLWGLRAISAPATWDSTTGSADLVVGVVDTGIDHTHPDLAANIWSAPAGWNLQGCGAGTHGYRSINGATSCNPLDDHSHGTHVAGTIGAVGNNNRGVVGVNWSVKLMGLKFLNNSGSGNLSDAVAAIDYAVAAKVAGVNLRVLNLSWTGTERSETLLAALESANAAGILVLAAAGNGGTNNDTDPIYPASYGSAPDALPNVVAVTATDQAGNRQFNYGEATVHLLAPGVNILSTLPGGGYGLLSGTSMATAYVSGAAALLLSAPGLGGLDAAGLKARLLWCGDLLPQPTRTITGRRLNVDHARTLSNCETPRYSVTPRARPTAGGAVALDPAARFYLAGTTVSAAATPSAGYRLSSWRIDGIERGAANPLTVSVAHDTIVEAIFVPETRRLTLSSSAGGGASASPGAGDLPYNSVVQLTATPNADHLFAGWTIDGVAAGSANPYTLTMDRDHDARANFAPRPPPGTTFTLDLAAIGDGTASADPPGPYAAGASVRLSAAPGPGHIFTGWTIDGQPGGRATPLTLAMTADRTVRATFAPSAALLLSWTQGGGVQVAAGAWTGGSPYPQGTPLTLTATTNSGYVFTGWTIDGAFAGWANPLTLTMDSGHTVVANFARRKQFADLPPGPPPYEAISQLAARLIILGYANDTFGPNDTTQRAQMAALICRAMGWDLESWGNPFTDDLGIAPALWRNVGTLAHYRVAFGYGDGRFGTTDPVTRIQTISFITRAMVVKGRWTTATQDDPSIYPNIPASSPHRLDLVTYYRNAGAVPGTTATAPWPAWNDPATRGWFAEALWQALDTYYRVDRTP